MAKTELPDDASKWFERIFDSPGAARELLQKFEPFGDQELLDLFRDYKETLVPMRADW